MERNKNLITLVKKSVERIQKPKFIWLVIVIIIALTMLFTFFLKSFEYRLNIKNPSFYQFLTYPFFHETCAHWLRNVISLLFSTVLTLSLLSSKIDRQKYYQLIVSTMILFPSLLGLIEIRFADYVFAKQVTTVTGLSGVVFTFFGFMFHFLFKAVTRNPCKNPIWYSIYVCVLIVSGYYLFIIYSKDSTDYFSHLFGLLFGLIVPTLYNLFCKCKIKISKRE